MPSIANTLATSATLTVAAIAALPMLGFTRSNSASHAAAMNARSIALGIETMATDTGYYAPAFRTAPDGGITHYSATLVAGGYASPGDFTSPLAPGGGAPAAGEHVFQADRLAFTVNGAMMPPEPLQHSGTDRHYRQVARAQTLPQLLGRWVRPSDPVAPATTLIVTEWLTDDNYAALAQGPTTMSHRPIVPFVGATAGRSPEREPVEGATDAPFLYPIAADVFGDNASFRETLTSHGPTEINAMGRSHAGGRAAMVMLDGSVRLARPQESVEQRLWGTVFHSITGDGRVR
ncbi:MAG: hypothetical protein ACIAS6_03870 [Phycisphaerales bacterium JB060]